MCTCVSPHAHSYDVLLNSPLLRGAECVGFLERDIAGCPQRPVPDMVPHPFPALHPLACLLDVPACSCGPTWATCAPGCSSTSTTHLTQTPCAATKQQQQRTARMMMTVLLLAQRQAVHLLDSLTQTTGGGTTTGATAAAIAATGAATAATAAAMGAAPAAAAAVTCTAAAASSKVSALAAARLLPGLRRLTC